MKCQHCHKRKATTKWVGEGGTMAYIHGFFEEWCEKCCLEAQIAYAEEHKNDLEKLKKRYEKIK